jgi:hypothetical protein
MRYDPLKEPDPAEWLEMDEQERLNLARAYHKRARIEIPGMDMHAIFHVIVENQIAMADETPVAAAVRRLMGEGLDRHDAIHAIGEALIGVLYDESANPRVGDDAEAEYFAAVEALRAEDWLGRV